MSPRTARIAALALPLLLVGVLASTGGWRIHGGLVERVAPVPGASAAPALMVAATAQPAAPVDEASLVQHLSPSVPWPAWAGLVVLCLLPAVGSMLAWSGARRSRDAVSVVARGAP